MLTWWRKSQLASYERSGSEAAMTVFDSSHCGRVDGRSCSRLCCEPETQWDYRRPAPIVRSISGAELIEDVGRHSPSPASDVLSHLAYACPGLLDHFVVDEAPEGAVDR